MRIRLFAVVLLAYVLAGCGIPTTGPIPFGKAPRGAPDGEQLYFLLDASPQPTLRPAATEPEDIHARLVSVEHLAAGPLPPESAAGFTTEVPAGLTAFVMETPPHQAGTTLAIFVSGPGPDASDATRFSPLAAAQIACTVMAAVSLAGTPVDAVTLIDKPGHRRGPLTCPLPLPKHSG